MQGSMDKGLISAYFNPSQPGSFSGISTFSKATGIKSSIVADYLKKDRTYTLHKPVRKRMSQYRKYKSPFPHYQWQCDLTFMISLAAQNRGFKYILTVIDIFSRYAFARGLKTKTGPEMIQAFTSIFEENGVAPTHLQADQGSEFYNAPFLGFLKKRGSRLFSVKSDVKACIVERFNRTLHQKISRYQTHQSTEKVD